MTSRSQAESYIGLGKVTVGGVVKTKSGTFVSENDDVRLAAGEQYVSRAGLKLASVVKKLHVSFEEKVVLDVGSSTGGFTDYALRHGAKKVVAVDVGTDQLHPSLRDNGRVELHEKTDIRDVTVQNTAKGTVAIGRSPDIVVIDVSFISLREVLPHIAKLMSPDSIVLAMLKPQFEAGRHMTNKGVIKNDAVRRKVLKDFEEWSKQYFVTLDKADSEVAGSKGNRERFYKFAILS